MKEKIVEKTDQEKEEEVEENGGDDDDNIEEDGDSVEDAGPNPCEIATNN